MRSRLLTAMCAAALLFGAQRAQAQDIKQIVVKHLTTSRDFTLKVAGQMPEADYGFKLTPPQMSFAEQMTHLAGEQAGLLSPFTNQAPQQAKQIGRAHV